MHRDIIPSLIIAENIINKSNLPKRIRLNTIDFVSIEYMKQIKSRSLSFHWGSKAYEMRKDYVNNNFEVSIWAEDNDQFHFCGCALGRNGKEDDYCSIDFIEKYDDVPSWIHGRISYLSFVCLYSLSVVSQKQNLRIYQPNKRFLSVLTGFLKEKTHISTQDENGVHYVEFPASHIQDAS